MAAKREESQAEKDGHQPKGGEAKQEKYPAGQMGTHGAEKVVGLAQGSCHVPKELISRVVKQETSTQKDCHEEKNETLDFFPERMRRLFFFSLSTCLTTQFGSPSFHY